MTPERWRQVDRIFQAVLDCAPLERQAFLDQACADDSELRQQVLSLLKAAEPNDNFLETPALEETARTLANESVPMRSGHFVGAYRLIAPLGAGGMGEVWRALDPALQRHVAIKVVPSHYASDPERLRRFQREAQAAGRLNHPNILAVYGFGEQRGTPFLVTELLEGATLRKRLVAGPIPETKAVEYAIQIAEGLSAAHDKGIVHRDLKPENVFVTDDGRVKILDFGLAKLSPVEPGSNAETITEAGIVMGSPGYMSPEQVRAERVDHRSDIFALGTVLYEMLTGRRAFSGGTSVETMNAILTIDAPPMPDISPLVERVVRHCLEKTPGERFQSARDLAFHLRGALHPSSYPLPSNSGGRNHRYAAAGLVCGLAFVLAIAVFSKRSTSSAARQSPAHLTRVTSDSGLTTDPALSQDGKLIAYASDRGADGNLDIWRQQLATGEAIRLTQSPADESEPEFSPDGSRIAYRSEADGGGIYVVSAFGGGEPRLIAKKGRRPRFSPDGAYLAYWVGDWYMGRAFAVPSGGGVPPQPIQPEFAAVMYPVWSPDGKRLLFLGARTLSDLTREDGFDWWVTPVDGGPPVKTEAVAVLHRQGLREGRPSLFVPAAWLDGRVLLSSSFGDPTNLWSLAIDPRTAKAGDRPQRLTFGTAQETRPSAIVGGGELAFATLTQNLNIWSIAIDANRGRIQGEPQKLTHGAFDAHTSVSTDGSKLAFIARRSGNPDVWIKDLPTGKETPLTITPMPEEQPEITRDGKRVCYMVDEGQKVPIYQIGIDGGTPERICDDCTRPWDWSPDGDQLLYLVPEGRPGRPQANAGLGLLDLKARRKYEYLEHPKYHLTRARFSPDGRWISFTSFESPGTSRIMIAPFEMPGPAEDKWIAITDNTTFHDKSLWSPDGNLLYFVSDGDGHRCVYAQRLDPSTKRPSGGTFDVYHAHGARRSLVGKGFRFLEISLSRNRLLFNLGDVTGNIWMTKLERQR